MMLNNGGAGPSDPLALLLALPLSHTSFVDLLSRVPTPLPPSKSLSKFVGRLNACLLGSAGTSSAADKVVAWKAVNIILEKDEGLIVDHGKGWLDAAMAAMTTIDLPPASSLPALALLQRLILVSSRYPSFERENMQPLMGKLAVSLSRLLERTAAEGDLNSLMTFVKVTKVILVESPAPFRASSSALRTLLRAIILNLPLQSTLPSSSTLHPMSAPSEVKAVAADLLALLHSTAGKSQASTGWQNDIRDALTGISYAVDGFVQDAYVEESRSYASPPAGMPTLPADPAQRVTVALGLIDGYTEIIVALLTVSTTRPVHVPISLLMRAALRCIDLTLQSPIAPHISPLHQALLVGSLPSIWTAGLLICGTIMTACGDHLLPHLSNILDHTIFLLEQSPTSMTSTIGQLLSFHLLFFQLYPPALVPIDYPTRLLKLCLAKSGTLLEKREAPSTIVNVSGGKRGKKRARGAEDGLIGSLEGREARPISLEDAEVILACLQLVPTLHATPLLSPTLLSLSIRLHLSLYLRLGSFAPSSFAQASDLPSLTEAVAHVLEDAATMTENQVGMSTGWKTVILSVLPTRGDAFSGLLHPAVPPMIRPQPPLSALHYFAPESEEESKMRLELGFGQLKDSADPKDDDVSISTPELRSVLQTNGFAVVDTRTDSTVTAASTQATPAAPLVIQPSNKEFTTAPPLTGAVPVPTVERMDVDAAPVVSSSVPSAPAPTSFISLGDKGKSVATTASVTGARPTIADDEDEPIPELDSGSSMGFGSDDDDEE